MNIDNNCLQFFKIIIIDCEKLHKKGISAQQICPFVESATSIFSKIYKKLVVIILYKIFYNLCLLNSPGGINQDET